ncbi:MAG: GAF domain-containing protein [Pleurocapsa minor HA4230-MV1]|jgi:methyl-accepting chemotaxis protein PixJ|nr:GAF domain-containing protein [Pleurocapsa minor HA4230-MV1]
MVKMSKNKINNGKDRFSSELIASDTFQNPILANNEQNNPTVIATPQAVISGQELKQTDSHPEKVNKEGGELIKVETKSLYNSQDKSIFQIIKARTAAILVGSAVMLPILAIGTATYYFGSQAVNKQTILSKRTNNNGLAETELARQQKLLAGLLIATGTTALLAGTVATLGTKRLLDAVSKRSREESTEATETEVDKEFIHNLSHSVSQPDVLKAIVEEARTYLNCDRVVVYSLNQDRYGVIVAESVALGYTQWLDMTIEDPCFEARYLDQYRDGRVRAINDISKVEMTPCHKEQLEAMEVKANLVTPIVNEGNLFGLLVAHQCETSREWQTGEIDFLHQLAKKAGLALKNAQLLDNLVRLQTQAETERQWTNYFTDAIQYIRQSIKQEDILEITVEEVRRVMMCDRVVVYSLNQARYGVVVAESVAAGYSRALNKTIDDPCFAARYLDKYRDGRVRAINNIYEAGMTQCYLEQLETLEVKANLVTPILNEGKLFGLLVAHQCSEPRNWQDYEIRWVTQIATQVGFALDNAQVLAESTTIQAQAERERKWTNYFTDAIQYIRQSIKQEDILEITVEEVRRVMMCDRVVVYSLNQARYGVVVAESVAAGYSRALNKTIDDPCFAARYLDKYRDGRVRAINNIYEAGMTQCYLEQLETLEVKANLVTPILNEGKLFGLLVAHQCSESRNWQDYEIRWVTQIATQVGFALDNAQVLAESTTMQAQAERERKWTNYFTDAIQYIRQSIKQEDILEITVEEVRRVMMCDRVVVYSLNQARYGVVVAESVAPGYPRALNKTIEDPCFAAKYLDKYRDGRVRAINNIYEAGMTQCYIAQLETLEVKANLVTPILNEGKLFGLLVAHQCSEPRNWQDYEIRWVTQIATQVGFALDNATLLKKLKHDGLPTQLLNNFSLGISEELNTSQLLKISVEQARKVIKLDRAMVYQFDASWNGNIVAESVVPGYPRGLNSQIKDPCFAKEYGEKYRQGRIKAMPLCEAVSFRTASFAIANIHQANLTDCHLEQLESLAVKASLVVPILQGDRLFGLLIGHQCEKPRWWLQSEIDLFAQLALQLGFALDRVKLRDELDLAQDIQRNQDDRQQLEQQNLNHKISELLKENQAALQSLQTKISRQSSATGDFINQISEMSQKTNAIINEDNINVARKAIAPTTDKIEMLNQSHQMVNPIDDLKEKMDYPVKPTKPAQLPMGEINVEVSEITLNPPNIYNPELDFITGQFTESSQSAPSLILMNQFIGEITNLSSQISQQSLFVTESFQKLAAFTRELSEQDKS